MTRLLLPRTCTLSSCKCEGQYDSVCLAIEPRGSCRRRPQGLGYSNDKLLQSTEVATAVQIHGIQPQPSFRQEDPQPDPKHHQDDAQAGQSDAANGLEPKVSVWKDAYDRLRTTKPELLAAFEAVMEEDIPSTPSPQKMLSKKCDEMLSKQ